MRFKQFISNEPDELFIEFVQSSFEGSNSKSDLANPNKAVPTQHVMGNKPWSAKKKDIMAMWQNLRHDLPILITPMEDRDGHTKAYGEDGIRVTGSWPFISSVLGRIKDLLNYESPQTRLRLVFRGVNKERAISVRPTYVFYVNAENRKSARSNKINTPTIQ